MKTKLNYRSFFFSFFCERTQKKCLCAGTDTTQRTNTRHLKLIVCLLFLVSFCYFDSQTKSTKSFIRFVLGLRFNQARRIFDTLSANKYIFIWQLNIWRIGTIATIVRAVCLFVFLCLCVCFFF